MLFRSPLVINAEQSTYVRVRYSEAGLAALTADFARLPVDDQLGLLADTQALALAGKLSMGTWMALLRAVPVRADAPVTELLIQQLRDLGILVAGLPTEPMFAAWARTVLRPFQADLGFAARPGEPSEAAALRAEVIELLGGLDDPLTVAEVQIGRAHV